MSEDLKVKRARLIAAAEKGVDELIKILEAPILVNRSDVSAEKMKNAAQAKKLAFIDAIEMLDKISNEKDKAEEAELHKGKEIPSGRFAESNAKKNV